MSRVSILVPIYNVADKIERCAVSLFEQTYKDIEYVFVNDCTPDNSIEVLEKVMERYPERKGQVKILHNETNLKQSGTRNVLLSNFTGEMLMFVDSDDYLSTDACEKLYNKMQETGADIVCGSHISLQPGGKEVIIPVEDFSKPRGLKKLLCMSYGTHSFCSRLYKAWVFANPEMRVVKGVNLSEDYMLISRVMLKAKMASIKDVVYYYDQTEEHDYSKIYEGHINQTERSVSEVYRYYNANKDIAQPYLPCLQMAFLSVIRTAARAGLQAPLAYGQLKWWARPIAWLMNKKSTFAIANVLYKSVRTIMVRS